MFRLESYITPIILNHVAKYVKNIRPQDAQVSLWEGEVAFQNLDLRLDVLEEELHLPFEFLSGHIHELVIHVPWTKINSEPINITINTIEFVLKLKDQHGREKASSPTNLSSPQKTERKKKTSRIEESQLGYNTPGLVNKIINNITINCHNIILKYVEEDIVVSMNVQLLSLHSADENWNTAFVDIHPLKRLIRKIVEITDLTICLDKRNSLGQIEVCQEPILYKCSLQIRLILKSFGIVKETRIALLTNLIEMNVSSLQFPMAIRLLNLMLALKTGDLKINSDVEEIIDSNEELNSTIKEPSWISSMWNMLPNLSFTEVEEEPKPTENIENILDIGLYVENLKFTLKSSEFINESIVGTTKKIRYNPIVSFIFNEIYSETIIDERKNWFSSKMGISKIFVESLGSFCEEVFEKYLIKSDSELRGNFILDSLFDNNNNQINDPITNINEYLVRNSEEYLNYRAPCFSFDITRYKKQSETTNVENNIDEIIYRLFLSSINFRYNTAANKIIDTIIDLIEMYDYPPYISTPKEKDFKLPPPLLEDYDSLMAEVPVKLFNYSLRNIKFKIFSKNELYIKGKNRIKTIQKLPKKHKGKLPCCVINIQFCCGKWITPQDPELLVHTTCQLPKQPIELLNACYDHFLVDIKNISVDLYDNNSEYKFLIIPAAKMEFCKILYPHLWQNQNVAELKLNIYIQNVVIKFTKPRLILCLKLIKTITTFNYITLIDILESSTRIDIHNFDLYELENVANNLEFNIMIFEQSICTKGFLNSFTSSIVINNDDRIILIKSNKDNLDLESNPKWIEWIAQFPRNFENTEYASFLFLDVQSYNIFLNKSLIEFLKYLETKLHIERDISPDRDSKSGVDKNMDRKSLKKSVTSSSRIISHPEETVHLSSEKDENIEDIFLKNSQDKLTSSCRSMFYVLKMAILNINVNQGAISFINESIDTSYVDYKTITIWTPQITCKSFSSENFDLTENFPIKNTRKTKESFPWTCNITSFSISSKTNENAICAILHPVQTNITVAINHKIETVSVDNCLFLKAIDQIQERYDRKIHYNYEDNPKRKREHIENDDNEDDIKSTKCDWSSKELNRKTQIEKETNNDENIVNIAVPSSSPKKIDRHEMRDFDILKNIETEKIEKDSIAINFHIDTSPILFEINTGQVEILKSKLDILLKTLNLLGIMSDDSQDVIEDFRIVTDSDDDNTIKEFLEMDTCSDSSSRFISGQTDKIMISVWLQWTVTKICLTLEGFCADRTKLAIEMEDFITSLDKQVDYCKIKSKLGTFSMRHFVLNNDEEIKIDEGLKFNIKTNNSELPFIDVTVTIADTKSVFKKIGAHKKADLNNQLYEIIVSMQAFETSLDLEKLLEFMPLLCANPNSTEIMKDAEKKINKKGKKNLNGSLMPLIYFDLGGFTVYVPVRSSSANCSVFILNVNQIKLSPNVKNPLTRKPVRSDVYNKAAQMGLLSVRGSIIEDRQYELIFHNISVATGNWNDLLTHMKDHENNLRNANPAFDWNHQNFIKAPLELQEVFNSFVISITYAPLIVYQKILVCGPSTEFNCVTDLNAKITTEQITLFSYISLIIKDILMFKDEKILPYTSKKNSKINQPEISNLKQNIASYIKRIDSSTCEYSYDPQSKKTTNFIRRDIVDERDTDSGISTYEKVKRRYSKKQPYRSCVNELNKQTPYEISFLAGMFRIEFYHVTNSSSIEKYTITPLVMCTLNQPSMLISQKVYTRVFQSSLHNMTINLSQLSQNDKIKENFSLNIFDTFPGKLDISGIPPSLFALKIFFNKSQNCQISCTFSKPIKINLQHKVIDQIVYIWADLYESWCVFLPKKCIIAYKEIIRGTKMKIIKSDLGNADTISFILDQLIIKSEERNKYEIEIILDNFKTECVFVNRPEKLNLKCNLDTFYIKTDNKICLHPLSINCTTNFLYEKWCKLPLVTTNINMNVMQIDIGVENLQNIMDALDSFYESVLQAEKVLKQLASAIKLKEQYSCADMANTSIDTLVEISLPKILPKENFRRKEEFYQDDLRAGAFQFVETHDDSVLPLPYQIHIIMKNHGIICWRYPQPRKIYKLHIFPIPMPVANPTEIKCQIEYFSELYKKFLPFCEFCLSETKNIEIELPKRTIASNIWRVNILQPLVSINKEYFDTSGEEDDDFKLIKFEDLDAKDENNFTLHPKVLVGCMKIDTCFNEEYIPKFEILIDVAYFELNLQNQQGKINDVINVFHEMKIANEFSSVETFLSFNLKNIKILAKYLSSKNYTIESELNFSTKVLDYGFSNIQFLVEETNLRNSFIFEKDSIMTNFVSDVIKINIDPGILHTLVVSARQWNERVWLQNESPTPIITRFIVANITQFPIIFGQTNTNENIYVNSKECVMYSFISDTHEPSLTFYDAQKLAQFSDKLYIKVEDSTNFLKIGDNIYVVETKKLSSTQIVIYVKGQVEILMMVEEDFKIQFRSQNADGTFAIKSPEYQLNGIGATSFCHNMLKESPKTIRIKFNSTKSRLWSGDIPLRVNKNLPWLVKVPINETHDFISFWFRIINEEIVDFKTTLRTPLRTLIMIWPIYQIKSMFPRKILFTESSTNAEIEITGRGSVFDLKVPATHETEHIVTITERENRQSCNLSLKTIDWNKFFYYDDKKWTINKCLTEFQQPLEEIWPYNNEEEMKIRRKCNHNEHSTVPIFKMYPSKEFSCTLLLEAAPWGIFINSLSSTIKIQCIQNEENNVQISSNELSRLFPLDYGFTIEVDCSLGWIKSLPIYFNSVMNNQKRIYNEYLLINDNEEIEIMFYGNIIHKAFLKFVIENERKVVILKPIFMLVNYSDADFYYIPFCLHNNHKVTREEVKQLTLKHGILIEKNDDENECVFGLSIDAFYNLSAKKYAKNKDNYFFCITIFAGGSQEITMPIYLNKVFNRKCVSLQNNNDSIPLSINCLEKDGQYYVSVFNDYLSTLQIQNWTDLNFLIAQTDSNEHSDDVNVKSKCDNYNFEWHQILKKNSTLYYTPPDAYLNFPDNKSIISSIIFAFFNEDSSDKTKNIRWSKSLRINASCEKFFNIPMFGDVKIIVCDKHKVTKLSISYIAEQLEFSVKDLRSRLISPMMKSSSYTDKNKFLMQIEEATSQETSLKLAMSDLSCKKCNHDSLKSSASRMEINFFIKEINLTLSTVSAKDTSNKSEILAIYLDNLIIIYDGKHKAMKFLISNLQIDNQQFSSCKYDFPVILSAQETYNRNNFLPSVYDLHGEIDSYEEKSMITLNLKFRKDIETIELSSILCKIKPIRIYFEDTFLNDFLEFLTECSVDNLVYSIKNKTEKRILPKGHILIPDQIKIRALYLADPIRLDYFRIEPLSVMFSVHTCIRFYIALDHSPLELAAFERTNITTLPVRLGYIVGMHYFSGALFGAGWVVGSLEILGSPSGLARCVTIGFRDFLTLPLEGFFRGPWGFIMGITHGSVSLLRNITAGTVNSVTKLASSVARNIDRLTFDEEHFQRTEVIRRTRPQGFTEGLSQGLTSFGINMLGAVGGLARHPLEAQNPVQIVTGVGKGIVGAIAKPISGAAELVALTGHGVLHTVGFNTQPKQRFSTINYKLNRGPANSKIWKLLPKVLKYDQILFLHEATLVFGKQLKRINICMTSTVLAIIELDKNELSYALPVDRVIASFDEDDPTLINVNLKPRDDLVDELMNKQFARRRIMDFLRSSHTSEISVGCLDDLLIDENLSTKLDCSFYICENLGHHLLQYLKIITSYSSKEDIKK